ncbi:MAG: helix-turn-helix domain protein [Frankiales bacterium]|nr:helix-turn-helix domain protein [Frankiales bacterium]
MSEVGSPWPEVAAFLRAQRQLAQLSLRHLARLTNVSDSYLSQVERGLHQPSPEVLKAMAGALGLPAGQLFERMGWLDAAPSGTQSGAGDAPEPPREVSVEDAIARDPRLTPAQKGALLGMYRTLVTGA